MRSLRILLVVNAFASSVTARNTVVVHRELSQRHEVEIVETNRRGHATRFAQDAARRGLDVVIGFGGDGTLNEVATGVAGTDTALGVLPGGSTNVFARTLGLENDPLLRAKAQGLMSRVLLALGQRDEARSAAQESIATLERSSATHPDLQVPLTTLGALTRGAEGDALLSRALSLPRSVDHEYRGDVFRVQAERVQGAARRALLTRARDDYAEAQVGFRVRELDALLK